MNRFLLKLIAVVTSLIMREISLINVPKILCSKKPYLTLLKITMDY
jgi:hypothetical protein